jgi:hypothetical protein
MAKVQRGRFTADYDQPFVVFAIGMRINRLWQFWKWIPVAMAMRPMLKTLFAHPEKGFLGMQVFFSWRTIMTMQYWRSFDDLERFARDKDDPHLEAWRRYNKKVRATNAVGVFHETYMVPARRYEAIYVNMPAYGLGKVTTSVEATGKRETARQRAGGTGVPAPVD